MELYLESIVLHPRWPLLQLCSDTAPSAVFPTGDFEGRGCGGVIGVAEGVVVERAACCALDCGGYGENRIGVRRVVELEVGVSVVCGVRNWCGRLTLSTKETAFGAGVARAKTAKISG